MGFERRFGRSGSEEEATGEQARTGYEKEMRDKIEKDPAEGSAPGQDQTDDPSAGDDDAYDPTEAQRECDSILLDESSERAQGEIDKIAEEMRAEQERAAQAAEEQDRLRREMDE